MVIADCHMISEPRGLFMLASCARVEGSSGALDEGVDWACKCRRSPWPLSRFGRTDVSRQGGRCSITASRTTALTGRHQPGRGLACRSERHTAWQAAVFFRSRLHWEMAFTAIGLSCVMDRVSMDIVRGLLLLERGSRRCPNDFCSRYSGQSRPRPPSWGDRLSARMMR